MNVTGFFPLLATDQLKETAAFYQRLGFTRVYDSEFYIHLMWKDDQSIQLGLLLPGHESQPPLFQSRFGGRGFHLTLEVEDVDAVYAKLKSEGYDIVVDLRDEAWGQRHFALEDPNGVGIDIVTPIEASEEFAAGYVENTAA